MVLPSFAIFDLYLFYDGAVQMQYELFWKEVSIVQSLLLR